MCVQMHKANKEWDEYLETHKGDGRGALNSYYEGTATVITDLLWESPSIILKGISVGRGVHRILQ